MKLITCKLPAAYVEALDELVRQGRYANRSEAIRMAIRDMLKSELGSFSLYVKTHKGKPDV
ncbi:MAG: ribbon-helix-helix domain-containing protein [Candidatus Ranarchaeia archaeon]